MEVMRKKLILFTVLLLFTQLAGQIKYQDVFSSAVTAYEKRNYNEALQNFLSLENEGIKNADLYHNIGNCYFRLNILGKAILYYKRALKLAPTHKATARNLEYILTFTKDKQAQEEKDIISKTWHDIYSSLPLNFLAILLLVNFLAIIVIINIIILKYRNRDRTVPVFILSLLLVLLVILSILSYSRWYKLHSDREAVLIASTAIGYSGPDEEFTRVFTIHEGIIFEVEKEDAEWSLIQLPNGLGGWIRSEALERVKS
ncbi:MAG: tetratricopeptide repeat protein [Candidatus Cloacimonetes bacterium]|nr:tetratricopeptide repeat protein [Candidatus Cloacimonadota bacterium]